MRASISRASLAILASLCSNRRRTIRCARSSIGKFHIANTDRSCNRLGTTTNASSMPSRAVASWAVALGSKPNQSRTRNEKPPATATASFTTIRWNAK